MCGAADRETGPVSRVPHAPSPPPLRHSTHATPTPSLEAATPGPPPTHTLRRSNTRRGAAPRHNPQLPCCTLANETPRGAASTAATNPKQSNYSQRTRCAARARRVTHPVKPASGSLVQTNENTHQMQESPSLKVRARRRPTSCGNWGQGGHGARRVSMLLTPSEWRSSTKHKFVGSKHRHLPCPNQAPPTPTHTVTQRGIAPAHCVFVEH